MKKIKILLILLLGIFIVFQSCEKKEILPEKQPSKLDYLKQLTKSDNFFKSVAKNNINDIIRDSLNGVLYEYYPEINDNRFHQNIIITENSLDFTKYNDKNNPDKSWWIEVISNGTLYGSAGPDGRIIGLTCTNEAADCRNIELFGTEYILY